MDISRLIRSPPPSGAAALVPLLGAQRDPGPGLSSTYAPVGLNVPVMG